MFNELLGKFTSPSWEGQTDHVQDMAASVSALEIFADRQPVDFGLTVRQGAGEGMAGYGWSLRAAGSSIFLVGGDWNMTGLFFHILGRIIPID